MQRRVWSFFACASLNLLCWLRAGSRYAASCAYHSTWQAIGAACTQLAHHLWGLNARQLGALTATSPLAARLAWIDAWTLSYVLAPAWGPSHAPTTMPGRPPLRPDPAWPLRCTGPTNNRPHTHCTPLPSFPFPVSLPLFTGSHQHESSSSSAAPGAQGSRPASAHCPPGGPAAGINSSSRVQFPGAPSRPAAAQALPTHGPRAAEAAVPAAGEELFEEAPEGAAAGQQQQAAAAGTDLSAGRCTRTSAALLCAQVCDRPGDPSTHACLCGAYVTGGFINGGWGWVG